MHRKGTDSGSSMDASRGRLRWFLSLTVLIIIFLMSVLSIGHSSWDIAKTTIVLQILGTSTNFSTLASSQKQNGHKLQEERFRSPMSCNETDIACLAKHIAVQTTASPAKSVTVCVLDEHYIDMFLNFAESAERADVRNLLPVTMSWAAHKALKDKGFPNYFEKSFPRDATATESSFQSPDFNKKGGMKFRSALYLLRLGYSVLILDLDTFFIKNPFPYFKCTDCDFEVSENVPWGKGDMCVGIVFFRPTANMISLLTTMTDRMAKNAHLWDQNLFRELAFQLEKKGKIKFHSLLFKLFPNGSEINNGKVDLSTYNVYKDIVIYHNNWILGKEKKIFRAKEIGIWILDTDGYYTSTTAKYITYENPYKEYTDSEVQALSTAFKLANILDRILILPDFHCSDKNVKMKCTLDRRDDITKFHKRINNAPYREHYFLRHYKVPEAILTSVTKAIIIITKEIEGKDFLTNDIISFRPANISGPTEDELKRWIKPYEHTAIIKFQSIYFDIIK